MEILVTARRVINISRRPSWCFFVATYSRDMAPGLPQMSPPTIGEDLKGYGMIYRVSRCLLDELL